MEEQDQKELQEIKEMLDAVDLSKWRVKPEEIEIYSPKVVLGKGAFGEVLLGRCREKEVAIKRLFRQKQLKYLLDLILEVDTMSQLLHPNVLLFMGVCTEMGKLMIITENMKRGSVEKVLKSEPNLSLFTRLKFCRDAALGMNWLHSCDPPVLHRDLKCSNLLVDENWNVKVCDFGLSIHKVDEWSKEKPKGSPLYMAPECLLGQACDERSDVYSFGYIVWEIVTRKVLFPEINDEKTLREHVCVQKRKPVIPNELVPSLKKVMNDCWLEPASRPTFKQLVQQINLSIVDSVLCDELARRFWRECFLGVDKVAWSAFSQALLSFLHLDDFLLDGVHGKVLRFLLKISRSHGDVEIERFADVLKWCGPLKGFLDRAVDLFETLGFHPDCDRGAAEKILQNAREGAYLWRFGSAPGDFVLALRRGPETMQYKLQYQYDPEAQQTGRFFFDNSNSFESFAAFLKNLPLVNRKISVGEPVPSILVLEEPQKPYADIRDDPKEENH